MRFAIPLSSSVTSAFQHEFPGSAWFSHGHTLKSCGCWNRGLKMVTLTVSKESKSLSGRDVSFLMDTGAECNYNTSDVYKVTGDLHLNFLNTGSKLVLV